MRDLPEKVVLNILSNVSLEDLPQIYISNKQYQRLCSNKHFWREKFERENLPILLQVSGFRGWYGLYRNSLLAREMATHVISMKEKGELFVNMVEIPLHEIRDPSMISLPEVISHELLSSYILDDIYTRQRLNIIERSPEKVPSRLHNITETKFILVSNGDVFRYLIQGNNYEKRITLDINLHQLHYLFYKLAFYGLLKPNVDVYKRQTLTGRASPLIAMTMSRDEMERMGIFFLPREGHAPTDGPNVSV